MKPRRGSWSADAIGIAAGDSAWAIAMYCLRRFLGVCGDVFRDLPEEERRRIVESVPPPLVLIQFATILIAATEHVVGGALRPERAKQVADMAAKTAARRFADFAVKADPVENRPDKAIAVFHDARALTAKSIGTFSAIFGEDEDTLVAHGAVVLAGVWFSERPESEVTAFIGSFVEIIDEAVGELLDVDELRRFAT